MSEEKIEEDGHTWIPIRGMLNDEERCLHCGMRFEYYKRTNLPCSEEGSEK